MAAPLQRQAPACAWQAQTLLKLLAPEVGMHCAATSVSALNHGAAASLLDQSELHDSSVARVTTCRRLVTAASTLHPEVLATEMSLPSWSGNKLSQSIGATIMAALLQIQTLVDD